MFNLLKKLLPLVGLLVLSVRLNYEFEAVVRNTDRLNHGDNHGLEMKNATLPFDTSNILARDMVLQVWNRYKTDHSNLALLREMQQGSTSRKFAVGYYSCPLQAGNRLHHFMNGLIWAVVTNRTFLWKYYDEATCRAIGRNYDPRICDGANIEADCSTVLRRAEWMPAFQQWAPTYNLSVPTNLSYWTTHEASNNHRFWFDGAESEAGVADTTSAVLVNFPQMLGQDSWVLHSERKRNKLLVTTEARRRADLLFRAGADFLYGHIFFESFTFHSSVSVPAQFTNQAIHDDALKNESITIVLHSRHSKVDDDGTKIKRERKCLNQVLENSFGFCQVMILSDRSRTHEALVRYLNASYSHCHALIAPHDVGFSFSREHGIFAGRGFYQDLAMVSNQTSYLPTSKIAFIGSKRRSSSHLIRELMTFQLNQQRQFQKSSPILTSCLLEEI